MALGEDYITLAQLKDRLNVDDTSEDDLLSGAISAASRGAETFCHRQFNQADTATARRFHADNGLVLQVSDIATDTDLAVATDTDGDGTFETTWSGDDYELEPLDGVVGGVEGWPSWRVCAVGSRRFPYGNRRAGVRLTAVWGWPTVPAPVVEAVKIVAAEIYKLKDAPLGVAGFGEFGVVRVRQNPIAASKLAPYVREPVLVG